jgi:hypothetical protein
MAKISNKTKKIRYYRSRIRELTGTKTKTEKDQLKKKEKLLYYRSRLKTLTTKKRTRRTHARTHTRARHPPQNEIELDVRDRFISPRVVSIAASSGLQPVIPTVQQVAQPSIKTTIPEVSIDISPITKSTESIVSKLASSKIAETDKSTSPTMSTIQKVGSITQPTTTNTNMTMGENKSMTETEGNSLHLSDLNVSSPTSSTNNIASDETTLETKV